MMTLNGWQRLGIVMSVVWLALALTFVWQTHQHPGIEGWTLSKPALKSSPLRASPTSNAIARAVA